MKQSNGREYQGSNRKDNGREETNGVRDKRKE